MGHARFGHEWVPRRGTRRYDGWMPSTVAQLMKAVGVQPAGVVGLFDVAPLLRSGVYVVALAKGPHELTEALDSFPVSADGIRKWLARQPELRLDGRRPTPDALADRLAAFWLPDEVVLYVGRASDDGWVRYAFDDFQEAVLRVDAPHPAASAHWLTAVDMFVLDYVKVHFAPADDPEAAYATMLRRFGRAVSPEARELLYDPSRPVPYANLRTASGVRKRHGLSAGPA